MKLSDNNVIFYRIFDKRHMNAGNVGVVLHKNENGGYITHRFRTKGNEISLYCGSYFTDGGAAFDDYIKRINHLVDMGYIAINRSGYRV